MACFMCGSSVAYVCNGDVFGAGPGEAVQGSGTVCGPCGLRALLCLVTVPSIDIASNSEALAR